MKNKQTIWITILVLLVVGLTSYIITDKIILKNLSSNNNHQENNNNNENKQEKEEEITVISYYTKTASKKVTDYDSETKTYTLSLDIPMIRSTKPGAVALNQKIQNDLKREVDIIENIRDIDWNNLPNDFDMTKDDLIFKTNYSYNILDNIVWIAISETAYFLHGSGSTYLSTYSYDINNDKELTQTEIVKKFDIDLEKAKIQMEQNCPNEFFSKNDENLEERLNYYRIENNMIIYYPCADGTASIIYQN